MSLKSMTGFGSATEKSDQFSIVVEVKSVNNRYLDLNLKLPTIYSQFEGSLSKLVKSRVSRGRVELLVRRGSLENSNKTESGLGVDFDTTLFQEYLDSYKKASELATVKLSKETIIFEILRKKEVICASEPGFVEADEIDESEFEILSSSVEKCLEALVASRSFEGLELSKALDQMIAEFRIKLEEVEQFAAANYSLFSERFNQRLEKLQVEVDQERINQEIALLVDKHDISEELDRLKSHLKQFSETLDLNSPVGRKLEFITQEFGREVNTIGSKCQSFDISSVVIEMKSILEKIKEQILNIE